MKSYQLGSLMLGLVASIASFAAEPAGIAPRPDRTQYFVTSFTESLAVGATLVSHDQVQRLFGSDVDKDYVVVEVGFYSKDRSTFPVRVSDFTLRLRKRKEWVGAVDPNSLVEKLKCTIRAVTASLPEIPTNRAVAGYMFFPATLPGGQYELTYKGNGAWLSLPLR